jgi:hypothetical protein
VLAVQDGGNSFELVMTFRPSVRSLGLAHLVEAAGILAEAHVRATTHGAFDLRCITVDQQGRVVVDGWVGTGTPADDVAAVGALLGGLESKGAASRLLRSMVARSTADEPTTRPGMAALAEALVLGLAATSGPPPSRAPAVSDRTSAPSDHRRNRRPRRLSRGSRGPRATLVAVCAVLVAALVGLPLPGSWVRPDAPESPPEAVLTIAGARWRVGDPGDLAAAGDWDCDGAEEPAVLRLDGTLWRWPRLGGQAELMGTVARGTALAVASDARGCDQPIVRDRRGDRVAISPLQDPAATPPRSPASAPAR